MPTKNLVMFTIDDMRSTRDWGHFASMVQTPNINALMERGTTFERAVTQVPLCNPSRSSVFTGRLPSETGVIDNDTPWYTRNAAVDTLPAVLRQAGTYVAMYGKNFHADPISAANQRILFDDFFYPPTDGSLSQVRNDGVRHTTPFASGRYSGPDNLRDAQTTDAAVDFLTGDAHGMKQPFFLAVGLTRPHLDWYVPDEYFALYDPAKIRAALQLSLRDGTILPGLEEYVDTSSMNRPMAIHDRIAADMDLWVDYLWAYMASVSYADAKVGEVLDALAADPALAADTSILLWSDNGFHLGDKDRWQKNTPWREASEVPLVIVDPTHPGGGHAQQVVSLVDIYPTVLDLMRVEAPARLDLRGNSLLPLVRNPRADWYDPDSGKGVALTVVDGAVSVRAYIPGTGDLRLTRYPNGQEELYNIGRDPDEHRNLVDVDTGRGLTALDERLHRTMSALLDERIDDAGIHLSTGSGVLRGTPADEMFISNNGAGSNAFAGGLGDDTYVLYANSTIFERAGAGNDMVIIENPSLEKRFHLPANIEMVKVTASFTGNAADNWIAAAGPGGTLRGRGGDDTLIAGLGNGSILEGGAGNDALTGRHGDDTLRGGLGNDTIGGGENSDWLRGGANRDVMRGGPGNDTLFGDAGGDRLRGDAGNDVFAFRLAADSPAQARDIITDFANPGRAPGDVIDLSAIDADTRVAGNQEFSFKGVSGGHVRFVNEGSHTVLLANTDGDAAAELRIVLWDGPRHAAAYTADDLIL